MFKRKTIFSIMATLLMVLVFNVSFAQASGSLEEIYARATGHYNSYQPYEALNAYTEGYNLNPEDTRFQDGIVKSQRIILSWSLGSHGKGGYSSASKGYNTVIGSPAVNIHLVDFAKRNLTQAEKGQAPYNSAAYLNEGNKYYNLSDPYTSLKIYSEGYVYYKDNKMLEGIRKSSTRIMGWSKGSHANGGYKAAGIGYATLIDNLYTPSEIKKEAIKLKALADAGTRYLKANDYYAQALAAGSPYRALEIYELGYVLYPGDSRFSTGIDRSRNTILSWTKGSHEKGSFTAAIYGYDVILGSSLLKPDMKVQVTKFKEFAQQKKALHSASTLLSKADSLKWSNPYLALQLYKDCLYLYPQYYSDRVIKGQIATAGTILSWSKASHSKGGFQAAIAGYETVLTVKYITEGMYSDAAINKEVAKKGILYNSAGNYLIKTPYNLTVSEMVTKQSNVGAVRSGKPGEAYWVKATPEEIRTYVDPAQALQRNPFQFLVLSGLSGFTAEELNSIVIGRGVLHNQGIAFRDAARKYNINEIYLIYHAFLETGNGTSKLASGIEYNGVKVYNVFGIGAYDRDPNGLGAKKAYEEGWTTVDKAIVGGAKFISEGYINNPHYQQDTLYKMRWNPETPATHQYATDIGWAEKQANMIGNFFESAKNVILRFDIPVFNN